MKYKNSSFRLSVVFFKFGGVVVEQALICGAAASCFSFLVVHFLLLTECFFILTMHFFVLTMHFFILTVHFSILHGVKVDAEGVITGDTVDKGDAATQLYAIGSAELRWGETRSEKASHLSKF